MKLVKVLIIASVIILFIIGGIFFIFGEHALQEDFYKKVFTGELFSPDDESIDGEIYGGGGSDGSVSDAVDGPAVNEITNAPECYLKRLSYSLRNFGENITCQEFAGDDCISLYANCSVEIYNHDNEFAGDFEIRYTLVDSSGNNLAPKTLSKNVENGNYELFYLDFEINDAEIIDENSHCSFNMVSVPVKEVCN